MPKKKSDAKNKINEKSNLEKMKTNYEDSKDQFLTTNEGLRINDNQNSLKANERGSTLLEDHILREKITHFDHERIPERVVHARGSAAHGYFQVYKSMAKYTKAKFLQDPSVKTPVFTRFSTVAGSRGSTDLARDVRGFAVKFYTEEGNYDLVGNNMPVFFIQDAIKFPDLIHAVKPEPNNEIPQAASAHDTFWDFISLTPESIHMIMWIMSDRAIPRSLRMMEGFGVHTFKFINDEGKVHFVKFHWKPLLGTHSVLWDEAQKISGFDSDFHRRDLWNSIENGDPAEWELGVQLIPEEDEHKFNFDLLDPTKLVPEELVPVEIIGKMTLNRNPENFFTETEQVAFHPGHLVPGIDFTNDPLLQGRLFSYTDTQLKRLGSPNFNEIPINKPIKQVHNNQRGGHMRQMINKSNVSYEPNTLGGGCPFQAKMAEGGFTSHSEKVDGNKIRARSESFFDFFTQAQLFFKSQSDVEKSHIADALKFELGKVDTVSIKERMLFTLSKVDKDLSMNVASGLGIKVPKKLDTPLNQNIPADSPVEDYQATEAKPIDELSPALSMMNSKFKPDTRKVAILACDGVANELDDIQKSLKAKGINSKIISINGGDISIKGSKKKTKVDFSFLTTRSVLFDAVIVPGGKKSVEALKSTPESILFLNESFQHCKTIALFGEATDLLPDTDFQDKVDEAVILEEKAFSKKSLKDFIENVSKHRYWERAVS